jgi:hypothetical protein
MVTAIGTLVIGAWGIYVKWHTKSVPAEVVQASADNPKVPTIPTVSSATGTVKS